MSKENHGFSVSVACEVGVSGAIVLQHFLFLQKSNISAGENWQEKWVKRSAASIAKTYPYWTGKQVSGICENLEKGGYISSKIENALKTDRTKSHILTAKGLLLMGESPFAKMENGLSKRGNANSETENVDFPKGEMYNKVYCTSFVPSFLEEKDAALFSSSENETLEAEKEKKWLQSGAPPLLPPFTLTGETIEPKPATVVRFYTPELPGVMPVEPAPPEYERNPRETQPAEFRRVNIVEEIERLKTDPAAKETFALVRKIPSTLFTEYVEAFGVEIKGTGETYKDVPALKKHFLNWSGTRFEIAQRQKTQTNGKSGSHITHAGSDLSKYEQKQIF